MTKQTPLSSKSAADAPNAAPQGSLPSPIRVTGARVHNLKNISLSIPRNRITVITGPSGSGKSSLAYDTIFAEGQRQYVESLSDYSRQFLHQLERPDVDLITGLQPTISIDQRFGLRNPRSTTATLTQIYDYLRVLYAKLGLAHCYNCGQPIRQQTPEEILETILALPEGTRVILLAPMVKAEPGDHAALLKQLAKSGLVRVLADGQMAEIERMEPLDPDKPHTIQAVIDRLINREGTRPRLFESLKLALKTGQGLMNCLYEKERTVTEQGTTRSLWKELVFSTLYLCPRCRIHYTELQPRTFSFNSPYGVCPVCFGVGKCDEFDPDLVMPDRALSLADGAFLPSKFATASSRKLYSEAFAAFTARTGLDETIPAASSTKTERTKTKLPFRANKLFPPGKKSRAAHRFRRSIPTRSPACSPFSMRRARRRAARRNAPHSRRSALRSPAAPAAGRGSVRRRGRSPSAAKKFTK